jgi:hypothetical protein
MRGSIYVPSSARLDARSIVHAAQSKCARQTALLRRGVKPADVAKEIYRIDAYEGQSRLTMALGNQFERHILMNEADLLRAAYSKQALLQAGDVGVVDMRKGIKLARVIATTQTLIADRLAGRQAPSVILGAALPTAALGLSRNGYVRPDALVASGQEPLYRVSEIKSYESREGLTSATDIESSAAQAAVELAILQHGFPAYRTMSSVDLVLRKPASQYPIVHTVPAARDLFRINALVERWGAMAPVSEAQLGKLPMRDEVEALSFSYQPTCLQNCGLAPHCRSQAIASGDPMVLGQRAATLLSPIRTIYAVGNPLSPATDHASERLTTALSLLMKVVA